MNKSKKVKEQSRWRLFVGVAAGVLFLAALIVHIAGRVEFDEITFALIVCIIGSLVFTLSQQLGIAKIAAGPLEVEIMPLVEQAVAELPSGQESEVWRVLDKYSGLFPLIGVRLLWVDDRPESLIQQRRLLRRLGIAIISVTSTEAAIDELTRDGDFALIVQDRLRDGRVDDARDLVKWLDTQGGDYGLEGVPLVVFTWDSFDQSIGVKEWNWITRDSASLLNRIAKEVHQWKKRAPVVQDKRFTSGASRKVVVGSRKASG